MWLDMMETHHFQVCCHSWADPEGSSWSVSALGKIRKSEMAIGLFRNTGTDTPREAIGPIASRGKSVRPSVKYVDDNHPPPPPTPPPPPKKKKKKSGSANEASCHSLKLPAFYLMKFEQGHHETRRAI